MTKAERAIADTPEAEVLKEAIFVVVRAFDVKEIVIFGPESSAAVKSMLGRCWNECANARDHLCLAFAHSFQHLPSIDFTAAEPSGPKITISLTSRSFLERKPLRQQRSPPSEPLPLAYPAEPPLVHTADAYRPVTAERPRPASAARNPGVTCQGCRLSTQTSLGKNTRRRGR